MRNPSTLDDLRVELISAANALFENDEKAAKAWLNRPLRAIGYETPVDYMDSPERIGTLRDVIGRLEHGIWT
jgi:putative toxin-antitoxin system antitoxin component (TIGR02293 family)